MSPPAMQRNSRFLARRGAFSKPGPILLRPSAFLSPCRLSARPVACASCHKLSRFAFDFLDSAAALSQYGVLRALRRAGGTH